MAWAEPQRKKQWQTIDDQVNGILILCGEYHRNRRAKGLGKKSLMGVPAELGYNDLLGGLNSEIQHILFYVQKHLGKVACRSFSLLHVIAKPVSVIATGQRPVSGRAMNPPRGITRLTFSHPPPLFDGSHRDLDCCHMSLIFLVISVCVLVVEVDPHVSKSDRHFRRGNLPI